jgi:hypothetical protein
VNEKAKKYLTYAVTVEFTRKGQALLKPGALISFKVDTGW